MSIQLNEYGFKADYQPVEPTAFEAAQGAALTSSVEWQEQLGADLFATGNPISMCRTKAMRDGWEAAHEAFLRDTEAEQAFWLLEAAAEAVSA